MSDTNRTVSVSLNFVYDPRSARAFAQMAKEAAKASAEANKQAAKAVGDFERRDKRISAIGGTASNLGAYGFAGRMGRIGSMAEGLQGMGMGGMGGMLQRAAVPLAIAGGVANAAEKVAGYSYDKYSTGAQIGRSVVRDLVPGGERVQKFADAMSGRAAGMEEADLNAQRRAADASGREQMAAFQLGHNPRQAGLEAMAQSFKGQSAVTAKIIDRSTSAGELAYRQEQRLLPLKQAEAKAERDMNAATAERLESQKELVKITARTNDLTRQRGQLEKGAAGRQTKGAGGSWDRFVDSSLGWMADDTSGVKQQDRLKGIEGVNAELGGNLNLQRQAKEADVAAQNKQAQARAELEKARARTKLQGQAETLEEGVQTAQGAGRRLGGMNQFDRAFGLQAARLVKQRGTTDGLPQEYVAAAQQFAPEYVGKLMEKAGLDSAEAKAGREEFGAADFGTADATGDSKKAQALRKELAEKEFASEAKLSASVAESGRDLGGFIADTIQQMVDKAKAEILNQIRLGRNT